MDFNLFSNSGVFENYNHFFNGAFFLHYGEILNNGIFENTTGLLEEGGELMRGTGTFIGNHYGYVQPGDPFGQITIDGLYISHGDNTIQIKIIGPDGPGHANGHTQLIVSEDILGLGFLLLKSDKVPAFGIAL